MKTSAMVLSGSARIDWNRFEESLYDRFAINAVTLTKTGERRTPGELPWANDLCALIKKHPTGNDKICNKLLTILLQAARSRRKLSTGECDAGMNKWVMPIIQDDEVGGFINLCGRPFCNAERIYTEYIQKTIDVDDKTIQELLPCLKPIDPRTVKEMLRFICCYT